MFPLYSSLLLSVVFAIAAYLTYGLSDLAHSCWIYWIISGLLLSGLVVTIMGEFNDCLVCRLKSKFRKIRWLETLYAQVPCREQGISLMIWQ